LDVHPKWGLRCEQVGLFDEPVHVQIASLVAYVALSGGKQAIRDLSHVVVVDHIVTIAVAG